MHLKLTRPLPGKQSHVAMAPPHRIDQLLHEPLRPAGALDAAVLVLLTPINRGKTPRERLEWPVLLIRRNSYPGVHSGQIAFPGGKHDAADRDFWATACREASEEVDVDTTGLEPIGSLTNLYVPVSNFLIHPFVAVSTAAQALRADPREVVDFKHIPVACFDPARARPHLFDYPGGGQKPAPAWQYEEYLIWGATAMMLSELHQIIADGTLDV